MFRFTDADVRLSLGLGDSKCLPEDPLPRHSFMGYLVGCQKSYLTYIYIAKSSINGPFSIAFLKLPEGFFDEFYVDF